MICSYYFTISGMVDRIHFPIHYIYMLIFAFFLIFLISRMIRIMNQKKNFVLLFVVMLLVFSSAMDVVAQKKRAKKFNCDERIAKAIKRYKKRRYSEVKTILDEVKINCSGYSGMDTVLYYLGRANLNIKQPNQASMEFEVILQDFPHTALKEEVQFLLGYCSYKDSPSYEKDQAKTKDAIRELREFTENYPDSKYADSANIYLDICIDKLAKKEYVNAHFYERIDKYDAAIVYYKMVIKNFPASKYISDSRLSLARNLIKVNRPSEARGVLDDLLMTKPTSEMEKKIAFLVERIKKSNEVDKKGKRKAKWKRVKKVRVKYKKKEEVKKEEVKKEEVKKEEVKKEEVKKEEVKK